MGCLGRRQLPGRCVAGRDPRHPGTHGGAVRRQPARPAVAARRLGRGLGTGPAAMGAPQRRGARQATRRRADADARRRGASGRGRARRAPGRGRAHVRRSGVVRRRLPRAGHRGVLSRRFGLARRAGAGRRRPTSSSPRERRAAATPGTSARWCSCRRSSMRCGSRCWRRAGSSTAVGWRRRAASVPTVCGWAPASSPASRPTAIAAYKQRVVDAGSKHTTLSRAYTGKPLRTFRNRWTDAWEGPRRRDRDVPRAVRRRRCACRERLPGRRRRRGHDARRPGRRGRARDPARRRHRASASSPTRRRSWRGV